MSAISYRVRTCVHHKLANPQGKGYSSLQLHNVQLQSKRNNNILTLHESKGIQCLLKMHEIIHNFSSNVLQWHLSHISV